MADPINISISAIPGEQIIVTIGQVAQSIIAFNLRLYEKASPEERTKLADEIIKSNLRVIAFCDRILDFLHVPKAQ